MLPSSGVDLPLSSVNVTPIGEWQSGWALRGLCLAEVLLSIFFNSIVLVVTTTEWHRFGTYKWFLANLAFTDLVYAVVELSCEAHLIVDREKTHVYMEGVAMWLNPYVTRIFFLWHYGGICQLYMPPLLLFINRFAVVCMPKEFEQKHFSPKRILFYFLCGYFVSVIEIIIIGWTKPERIIYKQLQMDWRYNYSQMLNGLGWRIGVVWLFTTSSAAYLTSFYCTYKVHERLSQLHAATAIINDQKQLMAERAMLKTIVVQGFTPMVSFLPVLTCGVLMTAGNIVHVHQHPIINWSINLLKLNGAVDGFMTLFTMKPYRRALFAYIDKLGLTTNRIHPE